MAQWGLSHQNKQTDKIIFNFHFLKTIDANFLPWVLVQNI